MLSSFNTCAKILKPKNRFVYNNKQKVRKYSHHVNPEQCGQQTPRKFNVMIVDHYDPSKISYRYDPPVEIPKKKSINYKTNRFRRKRSYAGPFRCLPPLIILLMLPFILDN